MNVYDFDQTIFYPDSSYSFVMYCLRHYPRAVISCLPGDALCLYEVYNKTGSTQKLKENIFSFLKYVDDVDTLVEDFWAQNQCRIGSWYLRQAKHDDLIISASPDFLVRPMAEKLGVALIATPMDKYSGLILGLNCHDREKVRRFYGEYPDGHVDEFYSDSLSDAPMAVIADRAYMIKKEAIRPWPENK